MPEILGGVFARYGSILDQIAAIRYFQAQSGVLLDQQDTEAAGGDLLQRFRFQRLVRAGTELP
ncbi:hypothetical protein [Bradyrhizobium sp. AUGA SZCCT0431]|uniref:hypothetical protein n=1 Tax=Bradyrhizobium sp. AUGA SZCCT0431 TaxID=2807674 RepID=UPI001BAD7CED|nr:hypothetical protein [Bradyrhizobium sp. AUGA SZCCT0431]MBR1147077.1 hypothetical protein [Bradyrhizobium sp. AUGA SZCCT0431]